MEKILTINPVINLSYQEDTTLEDKNTGIIFIYGNANEEPIYLLNDFTDLGVDIMLETIQFYDINNFDDYTTE